MSADAHKICPNCLKLEKQDRESYKQKALDSYGKVSIEVFEQLRDKANKPIELENTLVEYHKM